MTTSTIDVKRSPEDVFAYVTDPSRFLEWQRGVVSGHMDQERPFGVGAKCVTTRKIGFAERAVTSEVTHVEPPRTWGIRGIDGPIRAVVDVTVEPLDDGRCSRLSLDVDFEGRGIGKVLVPLAVRPQARREMPVNLRSLKDRLEASPGSIDGNGKSDTE